MNFFSVFMSAGLSLLCIWVASGIILRHTQKLTSGLHFPAFSFSLLLLGLLTSVPEMAVALNASLLHTPEISLGNLIGGQVILLLAIIPLLALAKKGLRFQYPLSPKSVAIILITNAIPLFAVLDGIVTQKEALVMAACYLFFVAVFITDLEKEHLSLRGKLTQRKASISVHVVRSLAWIAGAIAVIFFSSNRLVADVILFAQAFSLHPFFVSLFVVAFGTNIPEIVLAVRAVMSKKDTIALGDYIGSASANTILMSLVVLANGGVRLSMKTSSILIPLFGFVLFWYFARSKRTISRKEAIVLIMIFGLFLIVSARNEIFY